MVPVLTLMLVAALTSHPGLAQTKASSQPLEFGPLEYQQRAPFPHAGSRRKQLHPAYRVQAFGQATLKVTLDAPGEFTLEGPFRSAKSADRTPIGEKVKVAKNDKTFETALRSGIYRLQVSAPEATTIFAECTGQCQRPELTLAQIRAELEQYPKEWHAFHAALGATLSQITADSASEKLLTTQAKSLVENFNDTNDRFPLFPTPYELGKLQAFVSVNHGSHQPKVDKIVTGSLKKLLGPCDYERGLTPQPIHELLPEFSYGHYEEDRLSQCEISHSIALAQILTALALNSAEEPDKSEIIIDSEMQQGTLSVKSPEELLRALIASGHHVQLLNERRHANFLSMRIEGMQGQPKQVNSRTPVWIKTGLDVEGKSLEVPMGHSQHLWKIWGPLVNARVAFYLGISGAAFHPEYGSAPAWTGNRIETRTTSGEPAADKRIAKAAEMAGLYLRLNRAERKKLPADGYAVLGVCNDSHAFVELAVIRALGLAGAVTAYPLLRSRDLDVKPQGKDFVAHLLWDVPKDTAFSPEELAKPNVRKETLCRILKMAAAPLDAPGAFDATYASQLRAVQRELGADCRL